MHIFSRKDRTLSCALSRRSATALITFGALLATHVGASAGAQPETPQDQGPWFPFTLPGDRYIVLPVLLDGVASEAILDSGAGTMALSTSMASQLALTPIGSVLSSGVAGQSFGTRVRAPRVALGNITLRPTYANVFDLDALSAVAGRPIVVIIGRDLFDRFIVDVDFLRYRIAFRKPPLPGNLQFGTRLKLTRQTNGTHSVPVSIQGHPPVEAIFDLGSDQPLYLSADYVKQMGLLQGRHQSSSMSVGPGGPVLNTIAVIPEINIAGYRIGDIPVEIPENWTNQAPAVIGLPVLRRFRLMIDFHGEFVIMRPDLKLAALPFLKNRSGINVRRLDDALQVIYVAPGSPAEHAGLRVDDVIIAIDGSPLNSQYFASHHHDSSKPAGTVQRITLQGGRIVKLRLADYY